MLYIIARGSVCLQNGNPRVISGAVHALATTGNNVSEYFNLVLVTWRIVSELLGKNPRIIVSRAGFSHQVLIVRRSNGNLS